MLEFCATCLSYDRLLIPIRRLQPLFISISWLNIEFNTEVDNVCWECSAVIWKISRFQMQAFTAQNSLIEYKKIENKEPSKLLPSLSNLNKIIKHGYDLIVTYTECVNNDVVHADTELLKEEPPDLSASDYEPVDSKDDSDYELYETMQHDTIKLSHTEKKEIKIEPNGDGDECLVKIKLSFHEQKFIVNRMSEDEMRETRAIDNNRPRYRVSPYKCESCLTGYFTDYQYKKHLEKEHSKRSGNYKCPICLVHIKKKDDYEYHFDCHYRKYQCKLCDFSHHKVNTMVIHNMREHEMLGKKYECKTCNKGFDLPGSLKHHRSRFHSKYREGDPTCEECGKTYATNHSLKMHMRLHKGTSVLTKCNICGNKYRNIKVHMLTHNTTVDETAYCAECGIQFKSKHVYRRHLLQNTKHRQPDSLKFKCSHCESRFLSQVICNKHVAAVHLKNYPHKCHHCDKGFMRKNRLKEHIMERHEGVARPRDKICNYCGRGFKDGQVLRNHVRVHTGERPYECEHCSARFTQRSALRTHVKALHLKMKKQKK